jgi:prefoldin subunit 5
MRRTGTAIDVMRIEYENLEAAVRETNQRLEHLEQRLERLSYEFTQLGKALGKARGDK